MSPTDLTIDQPTDQSTQQLETALTPDQAPAEVEADATVAESEQSEDSEKSEEY